MLENSKSLKKNIGLNYDEQTPDLKQTRKCKHTYINVCICTVTHNTLSHLSFVKGVTKPPVPLGIIGRLQCHLF